MPPKIPQTELTYKFPMSNIVMVATIVAVTVVIITLTNGLIKKHL